MTRALVLTGPGVFGWIDRPQPAPSAAEVVVTARFTGLCGTDLHIAEGTHPRARLPLAIGHEFVGVPESGDLAGIPVLVDPLLPCGDCGACAAGRPNACAHLRLIGIDRDGALAGRVAVERARLHPVPDGVELPMAPLAEPLAVAVHAIGRVGPIAERDVVVVGAGPVGILLAHVARRSGAHVLVAETAPKRRAVATELGLELLDAQDPVADVRARTEGRLAAVAIDAAGSSPVATMLTELVQPGGVIAIVGAHPRPAPVDLQAVMFRELSIVGHRTYLREDIEEALSILAADHAELRPLISDIISAEDVQLAMSAMAAGDAMKVIVECPA
ncbi:MAG: alcohol dehydrogenase catalytic domain-containing protein [Candidatus Limnocylindrales bacterium]